MSKYTVLPGSLLLMKAKLIVFIFFPFHSIFIYLKKKKINIYQTPNCIRYWVSKVLRALNWFYFTTRAISERKISAAKALQTNKLRGFMSEFFIRSAGKVSASDAHTWWLCACACVHRSSLETHELFTPNTSLCSHPRVKSMCSTSWTMVLDHVQWEHRRRGPRVERDTDETWGGRPRVETHDQQRRLVQSQRATTIAQ